MTAARPTLIEACNLAGKTEEVVAADVAARSAFAEMQKDLSSNSAREAYGVLYEAYESAFQTALAGVDYTTGLEGYRIGERDIVGVGSNGQDWFDE